MCVALTREKVNWPYLMVCCIWSRCVGYVAIASICMCVIPANNFEFSSLWSCCSLCIKLKKMGTVAQCYLDLMKSMQLQNYPDDFENDLAFVKCSREGFRFGMRMQIWEWLIVMQHWIWLHLVNDNGCRCGHISHPSQVDILHSCFKFVKLVNYIYFFRKAEWVNSAPVIIVELMVGWFMTVAGGW